ncbi:MAG: EAL domain-containing protein [Candidatus Nitricoxidivorans perseverans]|uniref:EAL domain-containing protein n=1 Tax=Candidatus Nitricoxidivorans perseverans TaxID=2975601 RepID=A0AA49FJ67_9PROT|nr:MAG: EAL domain-containing protein [Candidatus Nitricoxidivorans perseverans]
MAGGGDDLRRCAELQRELSDVRAELDRVTAEYARALASVREQVEMLDHIHESVIVMDLVGYITHWNKGAERMFGYTQEEAVGRNILFLYADENGGDEGLHDAFLEGGSREMEVRRRKKSGEVFWASLQLSLIRGDDGQPTGLIGYLSDITERKRTEDRIHHLAYYDALTGLPNRSLFFKLVDQALVEAQRNRMHGALLFIDLNRFKPINDTLGHSIGDLLLQQIGARLRASLRNEDVVARLGGDEFVVALFDIARREHAGIVAHKLLATFDAPFRIDGHELKLGAAIGISIYPQDGSDTETLLRLADIAMYRAKQSSQDSYAHYSREMNQKALDRLKIESGLRRAIENDELVLHYQPKVDIASGRITGAEALVRWRHPEQGMVPPGEFIPVAEESGLVVQVGAWVLDAACAQANQWRKAGLPQTKLAVNLSAREFAPALSQRMLAVLRHHHLPPEWLELEITESMLTNSTEGVIAMMHELANLGVNLSLDDFGTGFSSLSYLKRFPIDTLKIDRSFVTGIPDDANDCAIAGAIVSMAKQLRHRVIAEGVETAEQLAYLSSLGCDEFQGYLFSPPVPAEQFEAMLREGRRFTAPS